MPAKVIFHWSSVSVYLTWNVVETILTHRVLVLWPVSCWRRLPFVQSPIWTTSCMTWHEHDRTELINITQRLTNCRSIWTGEATLSMCISADSVCLPLGPGPQCLYQAQWHLSHFGSAATPCTPPWVPARHFVGAESDRGHYSRRRGAGAHLSSLGVCLAPSKQGSILRTEEESLKDKNSSCITCDESVFISG